MSVSSSSSFANPDAVTWQIHRAGTADKPALVLVHGWGLHSGIWEPLLPLLENDFQIFCVDWPGCGGSDGVPTLAPSALDTLAAQLPASAIWCAWSLGGLLAMAMAERYPARVQALCVMAGTPCFVERTDWTAAMSAADFSAFSSALARDTDATLSRFFALQCQGSVSVRADLRKLQVIKQCFPMPSLAALQAGLQLLAEYDARALLVNLAIPVRFVLGQSDALVPVSVAHSLAMLNPNIVCSVVAGAAHLPMLSHPAECAEALRALAQSSMEQAHG